MGREIHVGDRDILRSGTVIECVEVYDDEGRTTGRWIEIGRVDPDADPDLLWEYGYNTGSTVSVIGSLGQVTAFCAEFGQKPGIGDLGSRVMRRRPAGSWEAVS